MGMVVDVVALPLCACGCGQETKTSPWKTKAIPNRFIHGHHAKGVNRSKHNLNLSAFAEPLTKDARYWIGCLLTDGCITNGYICLRLKFEDAAHVKKFAKFVGIHEDSVREFDSINNKGRSHGVALQFTGKGLIPQLAKYCVVPRKTLTAVVHPDLVDDPDSWRGVIDGDGCLTWCGGSPGIKLCGSRQSVEAFADYLFRLVGFRPVIIPRGNISYVSLCGTRARTAVRTIYYDGCSPVLDRKAIIAKKIKAWKTKKELKIV